MTKTQRTKEFNRLTTIEPRLKDVENRMKRLVARVTPFIKVGATFCANRWWYGYDNPSTSFRQDVAELVGWSRKNEGEIASQKAYDIAYDHLYAMLPDCNHDGMCWRHKYDAGLLADNEDIFPFAERAA